MQSRTCVTVSAAGNQMQQKSVVSGQGFQSNKTKTSQNVLDTHILMHVASH